MDRIINPRSPTTWIACHRDTYRTYTIAGRYCKPYIHNASHTLQILVHGITYTRYYFTGADGDGNSYGIQYSWQDYTSWQGYPRFAVDRLCNGRSSKPSGLTVCQLPMNAEVLYHVMQAAREGTIGGRSFSKILYIGHSLGSLAGNMLSVLHPDAVSAYVLTGFTPFLISGLVGKVLELAFLPALVANPRRAVDLDATYLTTSVQRSTEDIFYFGGYDHELAARDYITRGTIPTGEILTTLLGQLPAPEVQAPVLALNGQEDQVFCARTEIDALVGFRGECGTADSSLTAQVHDLYPNSRGFEYYNVGNTGHDANFHLTAQETFKVAHHFFARHGF